MVDLIWIFLILLIIVLLLKNCNCKRKQMKKTLSYKKEYARIIKKINRKHKITIGDGNND